MQEFSSWLETIDVLWPKTAVLEWHGMPELLTMASHRKLEEALLSCPLTSPQKKQQQKNTQSAQDLNWIEPKHECKHLIKVTVQNILVFITNLVDLRDESSLADCSYVNSCLEVLRDLVAVEQDIDISLKLLTTNAICWWAKQHHPLQKTTTKIKLKNLNWISLKTSNDSNSIMAQVLLGNETQSKNFLQEQEKKKIFFFKNLQGWSYIFLQSAPKPMTYLPNNQNSKCTFKKRQLSHVNTGGLTRTVNLFSEVLWLKIFF